MRSSKKNRKVFHASQCFYKSSTSVTTLCPSSHLCMRHVNCFLHVADIFISVCLCVGN